jgi:CheY-like chemotaxis protein
MASVAFVGQVYVYAVETVEQGRSMAARTPRTILVVDDEPSIVRGLTRLLRHEGYEVTAARNGCEALAQLHHQRYDVILTDLRMPTLDGCAFYSAAAAALARLVPAGDLSYRGER